MISELTRRQLSRELPVQPGDSHTARRLIYPGSPLACPPTLQLLSQQIIGNNRNNFHENYQLNRATSLPPPSRPLLIIRIPSLVSLLSTDQTGAQMMFYSLCSNTIQTMQNIEIFYCYQICQLFCTCHLQSIHVT